MPALHYLTTLLEGVGVEVYVELYWLRGDGVTLGSTGVRVGV
jgi:hypothetical protein